MQNLKELRKKKGVKQQEIADYLGITRAAYTNIENGKRETDFDTLNKLANYFDVSIDYLFGKTNDSTPLSKKKPTPETVGPALAEMLKKHGYLKDDQPLTDEEADELLRIAKAVMEARSK